LLDVVFSPPFRIPFPAFSSGAKSLEPCNRLFFVLKSPAPPTILPHRDTFFCGLEPRLPTFLSCYPDSATTVPMSFPGLKRTPFFRFPSHLIFFFSFTHFQLRAAGRNQSMTSSCLMTPLIGFFLTAFPISAKFFPPRATSTPDFPFEKLSLSYPPFSPGSPPPPSNVPTGV